LHGFRTPLAPDAKTALDAICLAVVFKGDVDLACVCTRAKEIGRSIETLLEYRRREKESVTEAFDQRALSMAVAASDAIDASVE
jgi:hypothetical protein